MQSTVPHPTHFQVQCYVGIVTKETLPSDDVAWEDVIEIHVWQSTSSSGIVAIVILTQAGARASHKVDLAGIYEHVFWAKIVSQELSELRLVIFSQRRDSSLLRGSMMPSQQLLKAKMALNLLNLRF